MTSNNSPDLTRLAGAGVRSVVLGAGVSGVAAARLLAGRGGRVTVLDHAEGAAATAAAGRLAIPGVDFRPGPGALPDEPFGLCVASPAFAPDHPWLAACRARGIPVVSELELGFAHWHGRILAITGSKGKSSLVKLCADTLNLAGVTAAPAGNYGTPLCELVLDRPDLAWAVTEVSSFQLEHAGAFRPQVGVLLNLQPDHLDRHADMAAYQRLKLRLFARQAAGDVALLPDDFGAADAVPDAATRLSFGAGAASAWRYDGHAVTGRWHGRDWRIDLDGTWFDNPVLGLAAAAGAGALAACGLGAAAIEAGFRAFQPLAHRVQLVAEGGGVRFIDDSKATSLAAVAAALQMVTGPVRLIAGGRLKEPDLDSLKELLTRRVRKVYLIGECMHRMCAAWGGAVACDACGNIETAVARASADAAPGEAVLLSPGCASFDQFCSYKERGERFTRLAREVAATR
jgi:UDP-N-acetylmuramoylalanine--D-glutamate ligase